jgi:HEAT repeat protein
MSTQTRGRFTVVLAAIVLAVPLAIAQQPPLPNQPKPGLNPPPPIPKRLLDRRSSDDPARWEKWWAVNKEDFLIPRAVLAPEVMGDAYTGTLGAPTAQEIRANVIPLLEQALRDTDHQVRSQAALALGKVGDWREIKILLAALTDREREVSEAAILALGLLGEGSVEHSLRDVLNDTTRTARERGLAAIALGYSGGDVARAALFDHLGTTVDTQGRTRVPAIESARVLGAALWAGADKKDGMLDRSPLVASLLQRALSAPELKDRVILGIGTAALSKPRDPGSLQFVLNGLTDQRADVRAGCAIAAGRIIKAEDRKSVQTLITAIGSEAEVTPRRLMLISLGRVGGPDARKRLIQELDANMRQDRAFAALGLGISGATDLAPRLRKEFEAASDDSLKAAVAIALGLMHDPDALKIVGDVAKTKGNPELLRHLMWFFALDRGRGSAGIVTGVLEEAKTPDVHDSGCIALGLIGELESQAVLINLLTTAAPVTLRGAAALGLGRMGDRRAIEPLSKVIKAMQEPQIVRSRAVAGLGVLCQRSPWPPFARVTIDSNFDVANDVIDQIEDLP